MEKIIPTGLYLHFVSRHTLQQAFTVTLLLYLVTIASYLAFFSLSGSTSSLLGKDGLPDLLHAIFRSSDKYLSRFVTLESRLRHQTALLQDSAICRFNSIFVAFVLNCSQYQRTVKAAVYEGEGLVQVSRREQACLSSQRTPGKASNFKTSTFQIQSVVLI